MAKRSVRCVARVPDGGRSVTFHQCCRMASVMDGDIPHCKVHSDAEVAKRERVAQERYEKEIARLMAPANELKKAHAKLARLQAENERLRATLEWVRDSTLETSKNIIREADEVLDAVSTGQESTR